MGIFKTFFIHGQTHKHARSSPFLSGQRLPSSSPPSPGLTGPAPRQHSPGPQLRHPAGQARSAVSGGGHSGGPGPVRRQRHGRQEHGLQLARHAGDLRVLRLVGFDQPGELQDPCKTPARKGAPALRPPPPRRARSSPPGRGTTTHLRRRC